MPPPVQRLVRAAVIVAIVAAFGAATIRRHVDIRGDGSTDVHSDVMTFVNAGSDLLAGRDLYTGPGGEKNSYVYPPFYALVNLPLTLLPPLAVDIGWYLLNILLLYALLVHGYYLFTGGSFRDLPETARWLLAGGSIALALRYLVRNAQDANINVVILFLILVSFSLMQRTGRAGWAALIGVAGAIKMLPMLFALYFIVRKEWKAASAMAVAFALATAAPALLIGPAKTAEFLGEFFAYGGSQLSATGLEVENFSIWGTLGRLFSASKAFEYPDGIPVSVNISSLPLPLLKGVVLLVNLGLAALMAVAARADRPSYRRSLILALLVMNLVSILTEDHHTVGFVVAYFFLLLRWREGLLSLTERWLVVLSGAASTLISYDLVVPLLGKLTYMTMLAYSLPVLPVGLLLTWLVWRSVPRASGTS